MKTIFLFSLFFIIFSVYARPNSCLEANLSDEQTAQKKALHKESRAQLQQNILEIASLTEDQRAALVQCSEQRKKRRHCPEANLSDEQTAQKKALRKEFRNSLQDQELTKEQRRAAWAEHRQNVLDTVDMSNEQRAALVQCSEQRKKRRHCPEANLSDEQTAQKKALHKESRAQLQQNILEIASLAEDQRAALVQCSEQRKKRRQ